MVRKHGSEIPEYGQLPPDLSKYVRDQLPIGSVLAYLSLPLSELVGLDSAIAKEFAAAMPKAAQDVQRYGAMSAAERQQFLDGLVKSWEDYQAQKGGS